jgi:mRNA interferase HigB
MFNIINRKTLLAYCNEYPSARNALLEWYHELLKSDFSSFQDLKSKYGNASIVGDDRVVFNVLGNKYRLVVRMVFTTKLYRLSGLGLIQNRIRLM